MESQLILKQCKTSNGSISSIHAAGEKCDEISTDEGKRFKLVKEVSAVLCLYEEVDDDVH